MAKLSEKVNVNVGLGKDGLGVTLQALFDGMETLLQSKTVVGEPMEIGETVLIPLMEISAGMASGALQSNARNNGAGAMSVKASPTAMLIIQGERVRLVNVKNQDIYTRLLDLIPEAIDKLRTGAVSGKAKQEAEQILDEMAAGGPEAVSRKAEVITDEQA